MEFIVILSSDNTYCFIIATEIFRFWFLCSISWANKCYRTTNNDKGRTISRICFYICTVVYLTISFDDSLLEIENR
jgi:hypothetical protein